MRAVFLLAVLLAVVLVWPWPGSQRWDVTRDAQSLAGKQAYLAELRQTAVVSRPNVLLLVADDLGKHDVSRYGQPDLATPHIDALASQGISFSNAYTTAPICAPSRAALLTGRYQSRFGFESQPMQRYVGNLLEYLGFRFVIDTDAMQPFLTSSYPDADQRLAQGLPSSEITLGEVFDAVGYDTAIVGKWHLGYGPENHPQRFGFDFHYGFLEAFTLYADEADPDVENHYHDLFWEEHIWSMQRSGPSAIARNGEEISEERYLTDAIVAETKQFIARARQRQKPFFAYVPFSAPHTPFQARKEDMLAVASGIDHNRAVYLAMIRRLDWAVGELVGYLEDHNELANTLVIFTSDNGGAAYTNATDNGPLRGGKFTHFQGGLEVPLFVRWGQQSAPLVVEQPVLLTDLYATLLAHVGLPLPTDRTYDSADLLADPEPRHLFWRSDFNRAVRYQSWKLLHNKQDQTILLFDLSRDPGERVNLADERVKTVEELMAALDAWERELQEPKWPRVMNYLHQDAFGEHWFAI